MTLPDALHLRAPWVRGITSLQGGYNLKATREQGGNGRLGTDRGFEVVLKLSSLSMLISPQE